MTGVVIVRERCAKTDPPDDDGPYTFYPTDKGVILYLGDGVWGNGELPSEWQPSVWFDFPRDTERETLTTDDLRTLLTWAPSRSPEAARLRAALDALQSKP